MSSFIEIHTLQWLPLSVVNRDGNGAPKTMTLGSTARGRWSSQSIKYNLRKSFNTDVTGPMSTRTRKFPQALREALVRAGHDDEKAKNIALAATACVVAVEIDNDTLQTNELLFVAPDPDQYAAFLEPYADDLAQRGGDYLATLSAWTEKDKAHKRESNARRRNPELPKTAKEPGERPKLDLKGGWPKPLVEALLASGTAVDLALFGRMLASKPEFNVNAACSVAHAFTTHANDTEPDYFIASDDLAKNGDGAGHLNQQDYTSGVFYRYASVNVDTLRQGEFADSPELLDAVISEFVRQFILLQPTAKEKSTAPYTLPVLAMVVAGNGQPVSLADAFLVGASNDEPGGYLGHSIAKLAKKWTETRAYGLDSKAVALVTDSDFTALLDGKPDVTISTSLTDLLAQAARMV